MCWDAFPTLDSTSWQLSPWFGRAQHDLAHLTMVDPDLISACTPVSQRLSLAVQCDSGFHDANTGVSTYISNREQ